MALLTDSDLALILCAEKKWLDEERQLYIQPFDEDSLTPLGYDLRVGPTYCLSSDGPVQLNDNEGEVLKIKPGETVLITTLEYIGMPKNRSISALILSKVTQVSRGLSHISTTIDPDWEGNLIIAIHNPTKNTVDLKYGDTFCTIVFFENKSPSSKDSQKLPGRSDILLLQWNEQNRKTNKKVKLKKAIPALIIIGFSGIGYLIFGKNDGFMLLTVIGVALAQLFCTYFINK